MRQRFFYFSAFFIDAGLALGYQGRAISGDGTAHVSVTGITTATRQGGGLVCVDTSSWQSYLGWSAYFEFNFNRRIWLKRDADTVATEGVFFCHLGWRAPFEATVSVGVYYPSECGYLVFDCITC